MSDYIQFGPVTKHVDGIEYDVSSEYEIVKKGEVKKLEEENERLKAIIENIQIESEKLSDYNLVHRVKNLQSLIALSYLKIKKEQGDE